MTTKTIFVLHGSTILSAILTHQTVDGLTVGGLLVDSSK